LADGITRGTMRWQVKLVQSQRKDQNQKIWNIQGRKSIVSMKFLICSGKKISDLFRQKFSMFFPKKVSISDKYNFGVFSETRFPIFFAIKVPIFYSEKKFMIFTGEKISNLTGTKMIFKPWIIENLKSTNSARIAIISETGCTCDALQPSDLELKVEIILY
jgi:hypothetical protein